MSTNFDMLNAHDKMSLWRDTRNKIATLNDEEALINTQNFWEQIGRVTWCLDYDHPTEWISPWEVINDNIFCRSSLAYMMYWTLHFSNADYWTHDRLELKLVVDNNENFIVLVVDEKYVLNLEYNNILDLKEKGGPYKIKDVYEWTGKKFCFGE